MKISQNCPNRLNFFAYPGHDLVNFNKKCQLPSSLVQEVLISQFFSSSTQSIRAVLANFDFMKIQLLGSKIQILSRISAVLNPFNTREGGNQYFLLRFTISWPEEAKMLSLLGQFWLIFIFHRNPASRQDCETQVKKCVNFIKNSKRPGQNPYKNALKSGVNGAEKF